MNTDNTDTLRIPVLPLRGLVVFPKSLVHFDVGRDKSITAINRAMKSKQLIFLSAQIDATVNEPKLADLYTTGVVAKVVQVLKQPQNVTRIVIEGKYRANLVNAVSDEGCLMADVEPVFEDDEPFSVRSTALIRAIRSEFEEYVENSRKIPSDIVFKVALCRKPGELSDFIASNLILDYRTKQTVLEIANPGERLEAVHDILVSENYILKIENEISAAARTRIDDNRREFFLREQRRIIDEELGEDDNPIEEAEDYAGAIEDLHLDEKTEETLIKECRRLSKMVVGSQEASLIRTYLDFVLDLPWNKSTKDKIVIPKIRRELDKTHFGLDKIKERIIEHLAVRKLSTEQKGQVICLVGPPGVGKTSIAKSIAKAMGRNCQRIALGGVKDEAEIRGHRRTYIGAMPGRIMAAVQNAGSNNPLIILDEIDKLANDYRGDPTSALLEVLDIEQNDKFVDHYLDVPFDLTNVMFITTANNYAGIPEPLRDRMEIIEVNSYTREEKINIAKKHLVPKQLEKNGFSNKELKFTQKGIEALIDYYTREAGVRSLERTIASVMRKCAVKKLEGEADTFKINEKTVEELLGKKKYLPDSISKKDEIGLVNGLAWTSVGGELLPMEVVLMNGRGGITLTGSLGDVMKESAQIAINCIRSHADVLGIDPDFYRKKDIHIHFPEGAVPKDGPSAGITMATAIYSALAAKPVRHDVAMTGEITLRGKVLPIGGLKEKSMAAYKNGISDVIIPALNERDIAEFDPVVREKLSFHPVEDFIEVLSIAMVEPIEVSNRSWNNIYKPALPKKTASAVAH